MTKPHRFDYAFYLPSFVGGGAERNCVLLANELCGRGFRVCLIVDSGDGPNRSFLATGVEVLVLGGRNHLMHVPKLHRVLREARPKAVFVQVGLSPLKYLLATVPLIRRPLSVVVYHGMYDAAWRIGGKLAYWLAPLVSRAFNAGVAVSQGLREQLIQRFRASSALVVVHNPVNLRLLDALAHESSSIASPQPYLVSMGRLIPQKGFATLLEAFALISRDIPHRLVIIGDGPQKGQLVEQAARLCLGDRIVLPGYLQNPFPTVRDADALVVSSVSEAFGNVLVEALSLGLRVVSTDCPGGPREILRNGEFGVMATESGTEALAKAILTALQRPPDPARCRARAEDFSVERIADQYVEIAKRN